MTAQKKLKYNFDLGVIDLLSLIALGFLVVSLLIGTYVITKSGANFNPFSQAKNVDQSKLDKQAKDKAAAEKEAQKQAAKKEEQSQKQAAKAPEENNGPQGSYNKLSDAQKAKIDFDTYKNNLNNGLPVPTPITQAVSAPTNSCDANGTSYGQGSVVVFSSGNNDYRKCVNGKWVPGSSITELTAVPVYLQKTYQQAVAAKSQAQTTQNTTQAPVITTNTSAICNVKIINEGCGAGGGSPDTYYQVYQTVDCKTVPKVVSTISCQTNEVSSASGCAGGQIVSYNPTTGKYICRTSTATKECSQGNKVCQGNTLRVCSASGVYLNQNCTYGCSSGSCNTAPKLSTTSTQTSQTTTVFPTRQSCVDSCQAKNIPSDLKARCSQSCIAFATDTEKKAEVFNKIDALTAGAFSEYVNAYQSNKVKIAWQQAGYDSLQACQQDLGTKYGPRGAISCNTYSLTTEQAASSIKLGGTITTEAALGLTGIGSVGELLTGASLKAVGGEFLTSTLAIQAQNSLTNAASTCITDPTTGKCKEEVAFAALSFVNVGAVDYAAQALASGGQALQTAKLVSSGVSALNTGFTGYQAVQSCLGADKSIAGCALNTVFTAATAFTGAREFLDYNAGRSIVSPAEADLALSRVFQEGQSPTINNLPLTESESNLISQVTTPHAQNIEEAVSVVDQKTKQLDNIFANSIVTEKDLQIANSEIIGPSKLPTKTGNALAAELKSDQLDILSRTGLPHPNLITENPELYVKQLNSIIEENGLKPLNLPSKPTVQEIKDAAARIVIGLTDRYDTLTSTEVLAYRINLATEDLDRLALGTALHTTPEEIIIINNASPIPPTAEEIAAIRVELHNEIAGLENDIRIARYVDTETNLLSKAGGDIGLKLTLETVPEGTPVTIIDLGLTNLKTTNDSLGHAAGDRLLAEAAKVVDSTVAESGVAEAMVVHLRGKEYRIILPGANEAKAQEILNQITTNIKTLAAENPGDKIYQNMGFDSGVTNWNGTEAAESLAARATDIRNLSEEIRKAEALNTALTQSIPAPTIFDRFVNWIKGTKATITPLEKETLGPTEIPTGSNLPNKINADQALLLKDNGLPNPELIAKDPQTYIEGLNKVIEDNNLAKINIPENPTQVDLEIAGATVEKMMNERYESFTPHAIAEYKSTLAVTDLKKFPLDNVPTLDAAVTEAVFTTPEREIQTLREIGTNLKVALNDARYKDPSTGLYNKLGGNIGLSVVLDTAKATNGKVSMVGIDLTGLGAISRDLGPKAGDKLILEAADIFDSTAKRSSDIVIRVGEGPDAAKVVHSHGDEFSLILPETDEAGVQKVVDRLYEELNARKAANPDDPILKRLNFDVGIAHWNGTETAEELVARVDEAMYVNKEARKAAEAAPTGFFQNIQTNVKSFFIDSEGNWFPSILKPTAPVSEITVAPNANYVAKYSSGIKPVEGISDTEVKILDNYFQNKIERGNTPVNYSTSVNKLIERTDGPVIELGGPSFSGFKQVDISNLKKPLIVSNITDGLPVYDPETGKLIGYVGSVDRVIDMTNLNMAPDSVGALVGQALDHELSLKLLNEAKVVLEPDGVLILDKTTEDVLTAAKNLGYKVVNQSTNETGTLNITLQKITYSPTSNIFQRFLPALYDNKGNLVIVGAGGVILQQNYNNIQNTLGGWWKNVVNTFKQNISPQTQTNNNGSAVQNSTTNQSSSNIKEEPIVPFSQKVTGLATEVAKSSPFFGIPQDEYNKIFSDGKISPEEQRFLFENYYKPSPNAFVGTGTNYGGVNVAIATLFFNGDNIRQQMLRGWVLTASGQYGYHDDLVKPLQSFDFLYNTNPNRKDPLLQNQSSTIYAYLADQNPLGNGDPTPITYDQLNENQKRIYDLTNVSQSQFTREKLDTIANQSQLTPEQALNSGKYIGIIATKSVNDIGRRFLIYKNEAVTGKPQFVGVVIVGDTAKRADWIGAGAVTVQANANFTDYPLGTRVQGSEEWGFDLTRDLYTYFGGNGGPVFGIIAVDPDAQTTSTVNGN